MAKPSYPRARRLAETVRRLVTEWLEQERAAERQHGLPSGLLTVTDVRVTPDLHHATVFYTVLGGEEQAGSDKELAEVQRHEPGADTPDSGSAAPDDEQPPGQEGSQR